MTATADKTPLRNKHLRNGYYFAIVVLCSLSIILTNYAKNELVGAPFK